MKKKQYSSPKVEGYISISPVRLLSESDNTDQEYGDDFDPDRGDIYL